MLHWLHAHSGAQASRDAGLRSCRDSIFSEPSSLGEREAWHGRLASLSGTISSRIPASSNSTRDGAKRNGGHNSTKGQPVMGGWTKGVPVPTRTEEEQVPTNVVAQRGILSTANYAPGVALTKSPKAQFSDFRTTFHVAKRRHTVLRTVELRASSRGSANQVLSGGTPRNFAPPSQPWRGAENCAPLEGFRSKRHHVISHGGRCRYLAHIIGSGEEVRLRQLKSQNDDTCGFE